MTKRKEKKDYIDNEKFSAEVSKYVIYVNEILDSNTHLIDEYREEQKALGKKNKKLSKTAQIKILTEKGIHIDRLPNYIAECFMEISERGSRQPRFLHYSWRDLMVSDAIENCLIAIYNYKIDAKTRSNKPNAFAYFSQICFFAFIRRIVKENKNNKLMNDIISSANIENHVSFNEHDFDISEVSNYVNELKGKMDEFKYRPSETDVGADYYKMKENAPELDLLKAGEGLLNEEIESDRNNDLIPQEKIKKRKIKTEDGEITENYIDDLSEIFKDKKRLD